MTRIREEEVQSKNKGSHGRFPKLKSKIYFSENPKIEI